MNRKLGIGAVTTGSNNWQPKHRTDWQRQRADGPLLPMLPERRRWWARFFGEHGGGRG